MKTTNKIILGLILFMLINISTAAINIQKIYPTTNYTEIHKTNASIETTDIDTITYDLEYTGADEYLIGWWKFENSFSDEIGGYTFSVFDDIALTEGKKGNAANFTEGTLYTTQVLPTSNKSEFSVELWFYANGTQSEEFARLYYGDANSFVLRFDSIHNRTSVYLNTDDGNSGWLYSAENTIFSNMWNHVVVTYDSNNLEKNLNIFCNNVNIHSINTLDNTTTVTDFAIQLGRYNTGTQYLSGLIDEFRVYDHSLTDSQIEARYLSTFEKYVSGSGLNKSNDTTYLVEHTISDIIEGTYNFTVYANTSSEEAENTYEFYYNIVPSITVYSPSTSSHYNMNLTFNISATDLTNLTATAYSITNSSGTQATGNLTSSGQYYVDTFDTTTLDDGEYNITYSVTDDYNGTATETVSFRIDNTNPTFYIYAYPREKYTVWNIPAGEIRWDIEARDLNLYAVSVNFTTVAGVELDYVERINVSGTTYKFNTNNITTDITGLTEGWYKATFTATDSHTLKSIKDYVYSKDSDGLTFIDSDETIRVISLDPMEYSKFSTSKQTDRYSFSFEQKNKIRAWHRFRLISDTELYYLYDSDYSGHFVTRKHWIDFENDDLNAEYKINKITDFMYDIYVYTYDTHFKSIGGLNTHNITYDIYLENTINTTYTLVNKDPDATIIVTVTSEDAGNHGNVTVDGIKYLTLDGSTQTFTLPATTADTFTIEYSLGDYTNITGSSITYTAYVGCEAEGFDTCEDIKDQYDNVSTSLVLVSFISVIFVAGLLVSTIRPSE